jgi:hypothetical protein
MKVVENNGNAQDAQDEPLSDDSEGEPSNDSGCTPDLSLPEGRQNLRPEDEMTEEEALKWLKENLVGCG